MEGLEGVGGGHTEETLASLPGMAVHKVLTSDIYNQGGPDSDERLVLDSVLPVATRLIHFFYKA